MRGKEAAQARKKSRSTNDGQILLILERNSTAFENIRNVLNTEDSLKTTKRLGEKDALDVIHLRGILGGTTKVEIKAAVKAAVGTWNYKCRAGDTRPMGNYILTASLTLSRKICVPFTEKGLLKNRPGEILQPQWAQSRYHELPRLQVALKKVRQEANYDKRNKKPKMMEGERYEATSIPTTEHTITTEIEAENPALDILGQIVDNAPSTTVTGLKAKKAPRLDGILPEVIEVTVDIIPGVILSISNGLLVDYFFPNRWKTLGQPTKRQVPSELPEKTV
ncbi:hypothetical protein JTB14_026043 [Gonioctena quinquepunctata]|nr:hypothetical protein JTB14_026043 [Gonioctena quinquepunctata]